MAILCQTAPMAPSVKIKRHKFVLSVSVYYLKSKMYNKMIIFIIKEKHVVLKLTL